MATLREGRTVFGFFCFQCNRWVTFFKPKWAVTSDYRLRKTRFCCGDCATKMAERLQYLDQLEKRLLLELEL